MIRPLGRGSFAIWIIGTVLGFVALTVGFPFFVAAVVGSCSADTCGAIMLVASSIVKPLLFWLFIVALLVALAARLRDVGVSPWLSAGFIFLMFVDHGFLLYAGSGWAFPMSMGVLSLEAPFYFLTAVAAMGALAFVPSRPGPMPLVDLRWRTWLLLALAVIVCLSGLNRLVWTLPGLVSALPTAIRVVIRFFYNGTYLLPALPFAVAFCLWPTSNEQNRSSRRAQNPPLPFFTILMGALALSALMNLLTLPNGMGFPSAIIMLPMMLIPTILPNALLLFALVLTFYLWLKRRFLIAAALSIALIAVYGTWSSQHYLKENLEVLDEQAIAALETFRPSVMPKAVLLNVPHGAVAEYIRPFLDRGDFDMVAVKTKEGLVGYRYASDIASEARLEDKPTNKVVMYPITSMPEPHLEFSTWSLSSLYSGSHPGGQYQNSSPFELQYVGNGAKRLVAGWYRRTMNAPLWLPILSTSGWREAPDVGNRGIDRGDAVSIFLASNLGQPAPSATSAFVSPSD